MKIANLECKHFLGLRAFSHEFTRPVTLFAGPNGAGKSSIRDALRFALIGEPGRVRLKRDYAQLLTEGQKTGHVSVSIETDDGPIDVKRTVKTGNCAGSTPCLPDALPYVLDADRFAALDRTARRKFLFDLVGLRVTKDEVRRRLEARGADSDTIDRVMPLIRAGMESGHDEAKREASAARKAWEHATGERYGSSKAEEWAPAEPAKPAGERPDADKLASMRQAVADWRAYDDTANRSDAEAAKLDESAILAEDELAKLHAEIQERGRKLLAAEGKPLSCPSCGAAVEVGPDGALVEHSGETLSEAEIAAIKSADHEAIDRIRAHTEHAERKRLIDRMQPRAPEAERVSPEDVEEAEAAARAWREYDAAAERAERATSAAAKHHADVVAWSHAADLLAPDGIPGDILADALGPVNARLTESAEATGWRRVRIAEDMTITADGRVLELLSESERWRAEAMLAEAIASLSGLGLLVLDRVDVLDLPGRAALMRWLAAISSQYGSIIALGTFKAPPAGLGDAVDACWLERGSVSVRAAA